MVQSSVGIAEARLARLNAEFDEIDQLCDIVEDAVWHVWRNNYWNRWPRWRAGQTEENYALALTVWLDEVDRARPTQSWLREEFG